MADRTKTGVVSGTAFNVFTTPVTATTTYTLVSVQDANCTRSSSFTGSSATITINPVHTITLTSGNNTQTVCATTPIANITYTLGGGATGATVTGLPTGVTSAVIGTTLTISGTPTTNTNTTYNYSISTTGNSCTVAPATGSIVVKAIATSKAGSNATINNASIYIL